MLAYGSSNARITGFLQNLRGSFGAKPRLRKLAVQPDHPENAAFTGGTAVTTETQFAQDFSLAALGAFMWIQPVLGCAATSGTGAEALGAFQTWLESTGAVVARHTLELSPDVNATKTAYRVLGKPFPALGLSGVMIAVAARGVSGSPTMNFVTRTFTGDPSTPSAWGAALLGTDKTFASPNEDYNTGNLAMAPGTVSLAQLGLKLPATTDGYGKFDIVVAAKY